MQSERDCAAKWDARYRDAAGPSGPAWVLSENLHLLPRRGSALDLACGLGANALLLARHGLDTSAWDISAVAIERLRLAAAEQGLRVRAAVRDLLAAPPEPERFDVIVVSHFLERSLTPALSAALRPGGLLFYQTFTRTRVDDTGPRTDAFRLADNELLRLFAPLLLVVYREEGTLGDPSRGLRNEAALVACKATHLRGTTEPP
jgi:2-polyprenyl-3-methyl-5-hydroxy-6-metoxy-1,4-benzoquinol methylase